MIINWLLAAVEDMEMDITLDSNRNIMGIDRLKELKMHTQNQNDNQLVISGSRRYDNVYYF